MLRVRDLSVRFQTAGRSFAPVAGVSFDLERGGSLALIGESGSGKTTIALSLLRLLPPGASVSGSVELSGEEVLTLPERALRRIRGHRIAMVFHDPLTALNPVMRVGKQIAECLRVDRELDAPGARERVSQLLAAVGLGEDVARRYPHQLSGGMRQRVSIAMAIALQPCLLVADEPTSALDPVSQDGLVALLRGLRRDRSIALLLLTHDLGFAARLCDSVAVLYAGRIVERGSCAELLARPRHPYTAGLVHSLPALRDASPEARLQPLPGSPPLPWSLPAGCRFRNRCSRSRDDCARQEPGLVEAAGRAIACFHPLEAQ